MEEAIFLTKYGSKVYIIHRRDEFRASKIMQKRALEHPKIEVLWNSVVNEAYGNEKGRLGGLKVQNVVTGAVTDLPVNGLFFAIGHEPATKFLDGQLAMYEDDYIKVTPGTTETSVEGVFAAGDVQDKKWRQAITAAGTGCMAALQVEHFLELHGIQEGKSDPVQSEQVRNDTSKLADQHGERNELLPDHRPEKQESFEEDHTHLVLPPRSDEPMGDAAEGKPVVDAAASKPMADKAESKPLKELVASL
eukprot:TRINITY_DN691_c0_g1_i1.p1 TRINITY_DN691_c0_g1~~TRINITY_DN691_c0_g1_i1.p1  ORF type:complete len:249 (-),score=76.32 TRINITY_DN691_c0_g1_i1:494-1240(-)